MMKEIYKENYMVCNCKQVSYRDIADAVEAHSSLHDVLAVFDEVQKETQCATGCGGCHRQILEVISEIVMT